MTIFLDGLQVELATYLAVWSIAVLYSIYCFISCSTKYFQYYRDDYSDFTKGWIFLSRKKDVADYEWQTLIFLIQKISPWIILSITISEILRKHGLIKILKLLQIFITTAFIIVELGMLSLIVILIQPLFFILAANCQRRLVIWMCNAVVILLISVFKSFSGKEEFLVIFKLNEKKAYITVLALFWTNLRCVSYCLDLLSSTDKHPKILDFISYCLYLPTTFCGPFISYNDFKGCYQLTNIENFQKRLLKLSIQLIRFLFWLFFVEFCLHFIYVNATSFHPEWVETLDSWSLYGYGYTMGQFFHIKYLVIYGLSTSFSKFENVIVPSLPVCIGRIHLYSDMWKYFDAGLYKFLLRYIYIPTIKRGYLYNRMLSSIMCFTFVYVWHGTDDYIMIWTVLNYIGITAENVSQWIVKEVFQKSTLYHTLGTKCIRRITCLVASPLLALSAISNFYFFARSDIGHIFAFRLLNDRFWRNVILITILYCCCQISTELRLRKARINRVQKIS